MAAQVSVHQYTNTYTNTRVIECQSLAIKVFSSIIILWYLRTCSLSLLHNDMRLWGRNQTYLIKNHLNGLLSNTFYLLPHQPNACLYLWSTQLYIWRWEHFRKEWFQSSLLCFCYWFLFKKEIFKDFIHVYNIIQSSTLHLSLDSPPNMFPNMFSSPYP